MTLALEQRLITQARLVWATSRAWDPVSPWPYPLSLMAPSSTSPATRSAWLWRWRPKLWSACWSTLSSCLHTPPVYPQHLGSWSCRCFCVSFGLVSQCIYCLSRNTILTIPPIELMNLFYQNFTEKKKIFTKTKFIFYSYPLFNICIIIVNVFLSTCS